MSTDTDRDRETDIWPDPTTPTTPAGNEGGDRMHAAEADLRHIAECLGEDPDDVPEGHRLVDHLALRVGYLRGRDAGFDDVEAERDALAAQVARVEKLAERFDSVQEEHLLQDDCQCEMKDCYECGPWHACTHNGPPARARQIRDALAGSEADTGTEEAGHKCEPYYSRAECGQCGWQEQWCATCSRQMCGCATETTDQEDQA